MDKQAKNIGASFQRGFSMLEALIALLVFTGGILGVAAMQVSGMRFTQGAQNVSVGTILADDMSERMRASLTGVQAGDYDNRCVCNGTCSDTTTAALCAATATTCPSDPATITRTCYGTGCTTTAAIRAADFDEWLLKICDTTPPGTIAGVFCSGTCAATSARSIVVSWQDVETSETTPTSSHQFRLAFNPIKPKN
jgi:type IV pilus modification protein PilV